MNTQVDDAVHHFSCLDLLGAVALGLVLYLSNVESVRADGTDVMCLPDQTGLVDVQSGTCVTSADLGRFMKMPVDMAGASSLRLTHPKNMSSSLTIVSCADYLPRHAGGWYALTQRDMTKETRFTRTCGTLLTLSKAKAASHSFIPTNKGLNQLEHLPSSLLMYLSERQQPPPGTSISDMIEQGRCEVIERGANKLRLRFQNMTATYETLARADFDGDTIEDLFVYVTARAEGGSAVVSENFILQRTKANAPYKVSLLDKFLN
jgi:hypothetical protein